MQQTIDDENDGGGGGGGDGRTKQSPTQLALIIAKIIRSLCFFLSSFFDSILRVFAFGLDARASPNREISSSTFVTDKRMISFLFFGV